MARMTAAELRARAAELPSEMEPEDDGIRKDEILARRMSEGMSMDEALRLEEEDLRAPGLVSFEYREFYERMAYALETEERALREHGRAVKIYWDPETQERSYDPPLTFTPEQFETQLRQMEAARAVAEERTWSKDPDTTRANIYRNAFDEKIEEFKRQYGPKEAPPGTRDSE